MSSSIRTLAAVGAVLLGGTVTVPAAATRFIRGDCNADANAGCNVTDAIFLLSHLFIGSAQEPPCATACDANDDGALDLSDAVYLLLHCFAGGTPPPLPYPDCGADPEPAPELDCAAFSPCAPIPTCAPQDARGVGACAAIVGIFWDGFQCRWESGCSCEGEDCDESFDSMAACYAAHESCVSACSSMDVRGVGNCRLLLGYHWNGKQCRALSGCECEGADCKDLYPSEEECLVAVRDCPLSCAPMDVHEVGNCEPVHGYFWDGKGCRVLSGCECGGGDCGQLFISPDECESTHSACQE